MNPKIIQHLTDDAEQPKPSNGQKGFNENFLRLEIVSLVAIVLLSAVTGVFIAAIIIGFALDNIRR